MIFCTAGHVDHGKTALVRALTGVDTDRLAEERRRGLTIELGFAPLELPGVGRVSLVDVPGHAQFIPTMLSGCGGLDGALFTVAADEGPMPQTAEHLDILSLLGLERGVVALTRADLASPAARAEAEARTRALTAGTFLEGAPRIFVSAVTGEGLEALRAALAAMARQAPPPPEGSPRLHVDRVFSVDGSGTVVTGTLTGGPLRRGDRVQLYPGGQTARVRGLQCHGVPAEALPAGVRAAVNLAGVRLRDVGRGDTLAAPGALTLTDRTDVSLRVEETDSPDCFKVSGRGELHLSVLIENMRREGFEFAGSQAEGLYHTAEKGRKLEPMERAYVDVPDEFTGTVIEKLSQRKGELQNMTPITGGYTRMEFKIPARGLIGYRGEFLTDTKGNGIINTIFDGYEPFKGEISYRKLGSLIAFETGESVTYGLFSAQDRGTLFIGPGEKVYAGMVIGSSSRAEDIELNVCKKKHLTNTRSSSADEALTLTPPRILSLEQALDFIDTDELLEVTPEHLRIRKRILDPTLRKRAGFNKK